MADEIRPLVEFLDDSHLKRRYSELLFQIARKAKTPDPEQMLHWAKENYKIAVQEYKDSPSPETHDSIAEAHFNLGVSYLRLNDTKKTVEHLLEQLRIKAEIGNFPGIAAGLFNIGIITQGYPEIGGAFLLSWEQMTLEFKQVINDERMKMAGQVIKKFLDNKENIERGRQNLLGISYKVLPYYERALKRRLG